MIHASRKTVATTPTSPAPLPILLYTVPVWVASIILMLFMPITGVIVSIILVISLLILPFKARRGLCPTCKTPKILPFSGFGNRCRGCGGEIVLRGSEFHLLEREQKIARPGRGRTFRSSNSDS